MSPGEARARARAQTHECSLNHSNDEEEREEKNEWMNKWMRVIKNIFFRSWNFTKTINKTDELKHDQIKDSYNQMDQRTWKQTNEEKKKTKIWRDEKKTNRSE